MTIIAAGELGHNDLTTLFLALALLLGLARLLGELARQWQQPAVLGEILAGVLLGPTLLGQIDHDLYLSLFPTEGVVATAMEGLFQLSVVLLLLAAGLEVDLSTVKRQGKAMLSVSMTGLVVPFLLGFALAWLAMDFLQPGDRAEPLTFALFVGIALSITALPVIAKILIDLNLAKSDMGMLVISSAMVNDVIGWIGFAMVLAMIPPLEGVMQATEHAPTNIGMTILLTLLFVAFMLTGGRWLMHKVLPYVQAHWSWPGGVLVFVMVIALFSAALTNQIGIHAIFGAFMAGIALGDSSHLRERTRDTIQQFILNIFAPLFFASIGLHINFIAHFDLGLVLVVLIVAIIGKIGGCYVGAKLAGVNNRESWAVGFGMVARGAMEIILGQIALSFGLISEALFVAIVIMALGTSLIAGPAIQRVLQLQARRRLKDVIADRHILMDLRAQDARSAIGELAERGAELTGLDAKTIYDAVWQRERAMSTGLANGLAVPHARFDDLKKPAMLIARSSSGVDFDSPDGSAARLICMILTPESDPNSQIEMLQMVAATFDDAASRSAVLDASTVTEILAALNVAGAAEMAGHEG